MRLSDRTGLLQLHSFLQFHSLTAPKTTLIREHRKILHLRFVLYFDDLHLHNMCFGNFQHAPIWPEEYWSCTMHIQISPIITFALPFRSTQAPKMSAGVAGVQEKLNKSLNQKGMVSRLHFLYYHAVGAWCDKFLKGGPQQLLGHIHKLVTVGRLQSEVWQNGWEERAFCWQSGWGGQHPRRSKEQLWVVQFFLETAFAVWVIFLSW